MTARLSEETTSELRRELEYLTGLPDPDDATLETIADLRRLLESCVKDSAKPGVPRYRVGELCRELAEGAVKRADLARKYGVTAGAITQFAKRHKGRIAEIKASLDDDYAGTWIARKAARVEAMQSDYELSAEGPYAGHYEQIRVRTDIVRKVAEELGEIPNKTSLMIGGTVRHELVGVDVSECFPAGPEPENP